MFEHSNEHNVQDLSDCDQMSIEVENDALGPNEVPMDTTEVPKDDFSKLYMELIERVVEIQSMWDENRLPVGVQDRMLCLLFGDFGGARVSCPGSKQSLARLLIQLPSTWEGDLGGIRVPACWDQLQTMLKGLGMVGAQRYRICTGIQGATHTPQLLQPSSEDNFAGEQPKCSCTREARSKKLKRDCPKCCEKCSVCEKPRKSMLSFDYIPIGPQLNLLTKSNTFCHEMLNIWRHKQQWLPKGSNNQQGRIIDFWNGSKFKEVKDFWDPMASYELPVVCSNVTCNKVYTTFPPTSKRHEALQREWDADKAVYDFTWFECLEDI
ncbi:hypothetical protein L7F22_044995 [Adiantum nelumboides]|nr:hypothetical protein [Adiantum nelumboides]